MGVAEVGCEAIFEGFAAGPPLRVWRDGTWTDHQSIDGWAHSVKSSVDAFCQAVGGGVAPPVTGVDGRRIVRVIEAAYESARTGRRITIG